MSSSTSQQHPVDPTTFARLAEQNLIYRLIDSANPDDLRAFMRADARGFLDEEPTDKELSSYAPVTAARRNIGVFDSDAAAGDLPVATVNSWVTPMTVPGGEIPLWAISSVTVAATRRRRGIARGLLEGELRAAAAAGIAVAGLTVSEATIYRRYGFASAVPVAEITVDTQRAGWIGPTDNGVRLDYGTPDDLAATLSDLHEKERTQRSGQIAGWEGRWQQFSGADETVKNARSLRGVIARDASGEASGVMTYTLEEVAGTFRFEMRIRHISALTPEALRSLWQFAVQHDLVIRVHADQRPVDDPLPWLVADQRAVTVRVHDHGWLRVLDVPAALQARSYRAPLNVTIKVTDSLGFAEGTWNVSVTDGAATVVPASVTDAEADVRLDAPALAALYAGGVSALRLRAAGHLHATYEVAAAVDDAFRAVPAPVLGIWY
ncbi:GNAT family N-acetyltransferase [Microbacterium sp. YY-01]|uniref:GNAT family N-acetyltransferase n=1 Tax=Microbacterium sp. YY-01 TaxID=3421634 RepID=UPI003D174829